MPNIDTVWHLSSSAANANSLSRRCQHRFIVHNVALVAKECVSYWRFNGKCNVIQKHFLSSPDDETPLFSSPDENTFGTVDTMSSDAFPQMNKVLVLWTSLNLL